jgi:hypothetical protein
MKPLLYAVAAFLVSTAALRADVFSFSYSGSGVSVTGTLTATAFTPGVYTVSDISGIRNGITFDSSPTGAGLFNYYGPSAADGVLAFSLGSYNLLDTVTFSNGNFVEIGMTGFRSGRNFSIVHGVPEPTTISLLLAMGLGVGLLSRKLPFIRRD